MEKNMSYVEDDGGRREDYGPGRGRRMKRQGDCVIRAISIALEQGYRETLEELCALAIEKGGVPNDPVIYREYLTRKGWKRMPFIKVRKATPHFGWTQRYRKATLQGSEWLDGVQQVVRRQPRRMRFLVKTTQHLVAVVNGELRDTWDCRNSAANSWWTKDEGAVAATPLLTGGLAAQEGDR